MIILDICLIYPQNLSASREIALGGSSISNPSDAFTIFYNPAGTAVLNSYEIGAFYSPAPFGLKELSTAGAIMNYSFDSTSISAAFTYYGFELYNEQKILINYASKLSSSIFAGASINLHFVKIKNYNNDFVVEFNAGTIYKFNEQFSFGVSLFNINNATFYNVKDQIPVVLNTGLTYKPLNNLALMIALSKETRYDTQIRTGIEYSLFDYLILRTGYNNNPQRFSSGAGVSYNGFRFDYAFFTHPYLGFTHQISLIYSL